MRKKSHISVAKYLLNSTGMEYLQGYKKSFYIGSILPDCVPTFITRRHCIEDTIEILKKEIDKITTNYDANQGLSRYFCRHLGVITHYVADYFTFPHNSIYPGNIKDHCMYEKDLKQAMRVYVNSNDAKKIREKNGLFQTSDEIIAFIKSVHTEYLHLMLQVKIDCMYIVELCHKVVDAILQMFELERKQVEKLQMA
ncbi:MAG: zinc dependent phospholipase C family protein [Velocimicrobium sp.]